ncbi:hypothetical protein V5799_011653 [Amblyomma americanum]|uniref:Uncharacterized protein n=1 Tax=Amblyomma americanum TaxID=6943 RepID=A0AAQ4EGM2_AMBAM
MRLVQSTPVVWETANDDWSTTVRFGLVLVSAISLFSIVMTVAFAVQTSRAKRHAETEWMHYTPGQPSTIVLEANGTDASAGFQVDSKSLITSPYTGHLLQRTCSRHERIYSRRHHSETMAPTALGTERLFA